MQSGLWSARFGETMLAVPEEVVLYVRTKVSNLHQICVLYNTEIFLATYHTIFLDFIVENPK